MTPLCLTPFKGFQLPLKQSELPGTLLEAKRKGEKSPGFSRPPVLSSQCLPLAEPWQSPWTRDCGKYTLEESASLCSYLCDVEYQRKDKEWIWRYMGQDLL